MGAHGKLHNIVVHIHGTPARRDEFNALAGRGIPLNNDTRWNSWYLMLQVGIEKESAVDAYTKRWIDQLRDDFLSLEDWEALHKTMDFLQPFYRATLITEGDNATIDRVLWTMDVLIKHYETSQVSKISMYTCSKLILIATLRIKSSSTQSGDHKLAEV